MPLVYLLGLIIFWAVFLTITFRVEKRMVWPYGELQPEPHFNDPTGYSTRWVEEARQAGFTLLGWAKDLKGPRYRINYAMLVSPERDIFAIVGVGTLMNIPLAATWLHTPTADGRSFYSTDSQSAVEIDLSRNWTNQLVQASSFQELLQKHRDWLKMNGVLSRPFTRDRELAEFRALRDQHYRSMERAGLIGFTDASGVRFRFTLFGAAKTATWSYFLGMARQVSRGRLLRNA